MTRKKVPIITKQKTNFRIRKSGKFWVVPSTTLNSWLNLGKRTLNHVKLKSSHNEYQRFYPAGDENREAPKVINGALKIVGGVLIGIGVGNTIHGAQSVNADDRAIPISSEMGTDVLAGKDSTVIHLSSSSQESITELTPMSLSISTSESSSTSFLEQQSESLTTSSIAQQSKNISTEAPAPPAMPLHGHQP